MQAVVAARLVERVERRVAPPAGDEVAGAVFVDALRAIVFNSASGSWKAKRLSTASYTPDQLTAPPTVPVSCSRLISSPAAVRRSRPRRLPATAPAARPRRGRPPAPSRSAPARRAPRGSTRRSTSQRSGSGGSARAVGTAVAHRLQRAAAQQRIRHGPVQVHAGLARRAFVEGIGQAVFDVLHRVRAIDVRHQHRQPHHLLLLPGAT